MRFCEEYVIDNNATQAAIRAGYSKKTAGSVGSENLKKPEIQKQNFRLQMGTMSPQNYRKYTAKKVKDEKTSINSAIKLKVSK